MRVSCIMPCNRPGDIVQAIGIFNSQDYDNKELVIVPYGFQVIQAIPFLQDNIITAASHVFSNITVGDMRNVACNLAAGDVILHIDSDDYYAPDWITRSVNHLISSGADTTGLDKAYFCNESIKELRKYEYNGQQAYACGATLCYYKRVWEQNKFPDVSIGEDTIFCANAGRIKPHKYINGFMAAIHGNNTASHNAWHLMAPQNYQIAEAILKI